MREVARQLHVSRQRAYELAARGRIPATRMGRRVIVPRAAWDRWCERQVELALARCFCHESDGQRAETADVAEVNRAS